MLESTTGDTAHDRSRHSPLCIADWRLGPDRPDGPAGRQTKGASDAGDGFAAHTILIVDDDRGTLDTFARLLRLEGYRVLTALSAAEALTELESQKADAVLLDFRMPIEDGLTFLRRIRSQSVSVPVAIVTGDYFLDDTRIAELRSLGAETWFKPLWLDDLTALVRKLLSRSPSL